MGLDQVIMIMFALGLLLHASPVAYMHAAGDAARGCAGIIVQFPIYAGIMAIMAATGLVTMISEGFVSVGNQTTMPLLLLSCRWNREHLRSQWWRPMGHTGTHRASIGHGCRGHARKDGDGCCIR